MSHLTTLVHRYLNNHPDRRNHAVANIIEYLSGSYRKYVTREEVEKLVDLLEGRK